MICRMRELLAPQQMSTTGERAFVRRDRRTRGEIAEGGSAGGLPARQLQGSAATPTPAASPRRTARAASSTEPTATRSCQPPTRASPSSSSTWVCASAVTSRCPTCGDASSATRSVSAVPRTTGGPSDRSWQIGKVVSEPRCSPRPTWSFIIWVPSVVLTPDLALRCPKCKRKCALSCCGGDVICITGQEADRLPAAIRGRGRRGPDGS